MLLLRTMWILRDMVDAIFDSPTRPVKTPISQQQLRTIISLATHFAAQKTAINNSQSLTSHARGRRLKRDGNPITRPNSVTTNTLQRALGDSAKPTRAPYQISQTENCSIWSVPVSLTVFTEQAALSFLALALRQSPKK